RDVVLALLQGRLRAVDRPERRDRVAVEVLQPDQITRRRGALQLGVRARVRARELYVAEAVGARQAGRQVVGEAARRGREGAMQDDAGWERRRGGGRRERRRSRRRDVGLERE